MKPVKVAMMSMTHGHTRKYYQTLHDNPKLDWIAVSTADEDSKERFLKAVKGVPCYNSDEEMLDAHPEIEAVVLASANNEHLRQVELCASRGIHILSMKIPTFDMDEYDKMMAAVNHAGIVCQVELELHYNPVVNRLKEIISSGSVGGLRSFQATNITLSPVWAFPWQGVPEKSYGKRIPIREGDSRCRGGALCDHPHIFDMIRKVTGSEFEHVYAEVAPNIRTGLQEEDMLTVIGRMTDGTIFSLDPSWSRQEEKIKVPGPGWEIYPKRMEVNITVIGEKGVLMADCFGPNVYHSGMPNDRYTVQYTYFDEWIGMMDEFVDCIRNQKNPQINLEWHKKTIEAMNACYDSIQKGQPVYLNGGH